MKERLLKYLKVVGLTVVALIIICEIVSIIIGANIKKIIVSEINSLVTVPVKVNGDIDFSLFSHFPYATVSFKDVDIAGSLNNDSTHLLKAHDVYLLFSIYNLFEKNYTIHRIEVKNAELNFSYDKTGKSNFDIFKTDTSNKIPNTFHITKLSLSNVSVTYVDRQNDIDLAFNTKEGSLAGTITGNQFQFITDIDALCTHISVGDESYLNKKLVKLESSLDYNSSSEKLIINHAVVTIEHNTFNIVGTVQSFKKYTSVDLSFSGKNLNLVSVASLLPLNQSKYIYAYHSQGDFTMSGKINGNSSSTSNPSVAVNFVVNDGELKNDNIEKKFKNISFTGELVTDSSLDFHKSNLTIKGLRATIDGQPITGSFALGNFHRPYLDMQINATVNLKNIYPLFSLNLVKDMYGNVQFDNVYYKGPLDKLSKKADISSIDAGGTIIIKNVTIVFDRNHLNHIDGNFKIVNNETAVNNLKIVSGNTDILFNGTIKNAVSAIFNAFRAKSKPQRVDINLTCSANTIIWNDLEVNSSLKEKDTIHFLPSFLNTFEGNISAKVNNFTYEKFNAKNITGTVEIHPNKIFFNNFSFYAINGNVQSSGIVDASDINNITFETTSQLNSIDINKLFYTFDNFDQNEITDKNLNGQLTIKRLFVHASWSNYDFNDNKLHVISDTIDIKNGELVNYAPMNALSSFVKLSELKDIHFSELQNNIEIKDRIVNIPYMTIHTNALNLDVSGTQTFDNIVDYNIKLNLLELLGNKFHKTNFTADNSEKNVNGAINLYLVMTGPVSNPDIKYDKAAVKKKIKEGLKEQKTEVKAALNNEFSKQKQEQNKAKDWGGGQQQFIDFSDTTASKSSTTPAMPTAQPQQTDTTSTRYKQKKAFQNFKNKLFHKNQSPPN